jgi:hypothetical protein
MNGWSMHVVSKLGLWVGGAGVDKGREGRVRWGLYQGGRGAWTSGVGMTGERSARGSPWKDKRELLLPRQRDSMIGVS